MSIIEGFRSHYRLFGPRGVLLVAQARLSRHPREVTVHTKDIRHPIHLRLRTTDTSLFEEIILNSEYELSPAKSPKVIVDAGANIGLTSVYFANRFPQARILAIEPEHSNFEMLKRNTAYYPNIQPILGALWKENVPLSLSNPGTGNWGFQTKETPGAPTEEGMVPGMTIDSLMERYGLDYIDLLKVDIEGSEKEVFETARSWIDRIGILVVELHDRSKNGCSRSVYGATQDFEITWCKGESTFFVRREFAPTPCSLEPHFSRGDGDQAANRNSLQIRILSTTS